MAKKSFNKEVKIGLSTIAALALLIYGANFLKGIDLFKTTNSYYLKFDNLDGLVVSNGVYIRGYKVGLVENVTYDFSTEQPFTVEITINDDINLPKGTVAYLFDDGLLGGKGINIVFSDAKSFHKDGDTLTSDVEVGLFGKIAEVLPDIKSTIQHADSLVNSVNRIVNSPEIANSLKNIEKITADLKKTSYSLNYMMNVKFPPIVANIDSITDDIQDISSRLTQTDFVRIMSGLDTTVQNVKELSERINSNEGTVGRLLNDNALYMDIDSTVRSVNALVIDLKQNPKDYVHFSLFGPRKKKDKK
ncbi:MAG: MlaD family protein [Paludibacteraceae bacterium]|nr:MlaD family protein [Paludibacteraceae bacterium]